MSAFYGAYDEETIGGGDDSGSGTGGYTTRNLQLDFNFKGGSGTTVTDKVNNKVGTLGSGSLTWNADGLTFGATTGSIVTVSDTTTGVYQPTTELTLEAYVKPTANTEFGNVIGRASLYHFSLSVNEGKPAIMLYDNYCNSTIALENNKYYHIVGTYEKTSGMLKLYINGVLNNSRAMGNIDIPNTALDGNAYDFTVGGQDVVAHYFNGLIVFARYYNVALTQEEIETNYNTI